MEVFKEEQDFSLGFVVSAWESRMLVPQRKRVRTTREENFSMNPFLGTTEGARAAFCDWPPQALLRTGYQGPQRLHPLAEGADGGRRTDLRRRSSATAAFRPAAAQLFSGAANARPRQSYGPHCHHEQSLPNKVSPFCSKIEDLALTRLRPSISCERFCLAVQEHRQRPTETLRSRARLPWPR